MQERRIRLLVVSASASPDAAALLSAQSGLDVTFVDSHAAMHDALARGEYDGCLVTPEEAVSLVDSPADLTSALRERVKELQTLYAATRLLDRSQEEPLLERLQQLVDLLPQGWLYPGITVVRLTIDDLVIASPGFRETAWMQTAQIRLPVGGRLEVALLEERPERDEGPFLREERELLDALARVICDAVLYRRIEQLHTLTIASLEEAVVIIDSSGEGRRIVDVNPAAERMFGYTRAQLIGRTTELLHVDGVTFERFGRESEAALERENAFHASVPMRRRDGTVFEAEQTVTLLRPGRGVHGGAVSVVRDISARSRAEAGLRQSEERFRLIAEHIDHVIRIRTKGRMGLDYVSPAYEHVWQRSADELYQDAANLLSYVLPSDRAAVAAMLDTTETGWEHEYRIVRPDGEVRWILDRGFPVAGEGGNPGRVIGVAEDITVRKRLEQRFGVLSQEISDVIYVVGTDGTVLLSSPSVETAVGYSPAEFVGRNAFDFVHPEDAAEVKQRFAALVVRPGELARMQYRVLARDGSVRYVESVARNLIDYPDVAGILITSRDVTERRELEERSHQSQKLEAVGQLAGGIAHDFNNIITVIRSQTELLLLDDPPEPFAREIGIMQAAADRAAGLTAQLLAFSRDQVLRPRVVDLRAVVSGMDRIIERAVGERISVQYDLPDELPSVRVDPVQLEQVLMNLAVNARDAMPSGGTLRIAARAEQHAAAAEGEAPEPLVVLTVADTGVGMSDSVRSRIFEPFFSTKPLGKGTGLGLAMVYGVVTQSGGTVSVDSAPNAGTTFRLAFPGLHEEPETVDTAHSRAAATDATWGRVLLVEDEVNVRRVTRALLERAGYEVVDVPDAERALAQLQHAAFDLLLTDLGLPGMTGRELVQQVMSASSPLPIVVMSGYDVESESQRAELPKSVFFLPKPYTRQGLLDAVADRLASAPRGTPLNPRPESA